MGSRYPEITRNSLEIPDKETPLIPDRSCPDNESQNLGNSG